MSTLLLRLAGPLQSWGTASRFVRRGTDRWPSRSGVIGLLAAARGLRRTDPLEELLTLRIGVRIDSAGRLERDFQTAQGMPLSYRFYLADAVFVAGVEGDPNLLAGLAEALRHPHFPLYLGRRACPPAGPVRPELVNTDLPTALAYRAWWASQQVMSDHHHPTVSLNTVLDCPPGEQDAFTIRDDPISFDPRHRQYSWRSVRRSHVEVDNPRYQPPAPADDHNPLAAF